MRRVVAMVVLLAAWTLLPARPTAQDAETPDPAVVQAIESADLFAQQGSWSEAARVLHGAGRSTLARSARIASSYRVAPGVVLRMTDEPRATVRGRDLESEVLSTFGHVAGAVGAVGGAFSVLFVTLLGALISGGISTTLGTLMAITGGGGLAFALTGIGLHAAAGGRRGALMDLLERSGATPRAGCSFGVSF
jgi:hypothetical protein